MHIIIGLLIGWSVYQAVSRRNPYPLALIFAIGLTLHFLGS